MVNLDKIEAFRDEVNEDMFVLSKYRNVNGKNQWGCICSAMDWITVAIEYISRFNTDKKEIQSMEMFTYISSIDVVWEGIQQLHRVIFSDIKRLPYEGEYECFNSRIYDDKDDNSYFKEIRASFGAHPVNLQGENGERLFASWSGNFLSGGYSVILYSNSPDKPFKQMSIYMHELDAFLKKRYNYLDSLIFEIQHQRKLLYSELQQKEILRLDNPVEQLQILRKEIQDRNFGDYYEYVVEKLILIFDTPISSKENELMVDRYRDNLRPLIKILCDKIQNMDICDIDDELLHPSPKSLPDGYGYWIEKLVNYISGSEYIYAYWEEKLQRIFDGKFVMDYKNYEEFYVLILACMSELE